MNRITIAVTLALVTAGVNAESKRYSQVADFAGEKVVLHESLAYFLAIDSGEVKPLENRIASETDAVEIERLARRLFDLGDGEQLLNLAEAHERRMDLIGAYAHYYALDKLAKMNAKRLPPDAVVRGPYFAAIAKQVERLNARISPQQKASAIKQAARLIRDNPNCCLAM